ncbi:rRNA-processing protein [Hanseniaspora uvarum]|nr:rRNA-processing protein [Hanseniaspora uvarum]
MVKSTNDKIQKYITKQQKATDYDIENEGLKNFSSDSDDSSDEEDNRKEHYVSVGKSKLRQQLDTKQRENDLLKEGKKVSRKDLFNNENSHDFEEDDEEYVSAEEDQSSEEENSAEQEESSEEEQSEKSSSSESETAAPKPQLNTYEQFNQIQSKDAIKGKSIIDQNKEFDSILDIRMQLQKAITVFNTNYKVENLNKELKHIAKENNTLLKDIIKELNKKRLILHKKDHFTTREYTTNTDDYKKVTKDLNSTLSRFNKVTLSKWAKKTLPTDQNLLEHIDNLLLDKHKLVSSLRQPKFNDIQFYKNLLNQLIQQKLNTSNSNSSLAINGNKPTEIRLIKKDNSGNKASKGRKLDYTVQQKLINYETPNLNNKMWDDFKRDEFFVGLFGRKVDIWSMDQSEEESSDSDSEISEEEIVNDGLQIFG